MATKPAPAPRPKHLPDAEVQALADMALLAWESGIEARPLDTLGGEWSMLPERSATSGLWLFRTLGEEPDAVVSRQFVNAADMGVEMVRHSLAARVMALVNPA